MLISYKTELKDDVLQSPNIKSVYSNSRWGDTLSSKYIFKSLIGIKSEISEIVTQNFILEELIERVESVWSNMNKNVWTSFSNNLEMLSLRIQQPKESPKFWYVNSIKNIAANIDWNLLILNLYGIRIPQIEEVKNYLLEYPDIINLVVNISKDSLDEFDRETQLSLEIYQDPEIEDKYLTLYVRQQDYQEDVMDIIDNITQRYRNELTSIKGWFIVSTDFDYPRE